MKYVLNLIGAFVIFTLGYGVGHFDQAASAAAETIKTANQAVAMVLNQSCPSVEALAASKGWTYVGVIDEKYNGHRVFVPNNDTLPPGYEGIRQDNSVISLTATNRSIPGGTYNSVYPKTGCVALAPAPAPAAQPNTQPHLATCVDAPSATQPAAPAAQAAPTGSCDIVGLGAQRQWEYVQASDHGGHLFKLSKGDMLPAGFEAVVEGGRKILSNSLGDDRYMPQGFVTVYCAK